jgi:hypothetical protein
MARKEMMDINGQTFQMLLDRFDRVDKDNDDIKQSIVAHVEKDSDFYERVERHSTYWNLALWFIGAGVIGGITAYFRWLLK